MKSPRTRRHPGTRGRLLDYHDRIKAGVKRPVDMRAYISPAAERTLQEFAAAHGVTKSGLAGLVLEAFARGVDLQTVLSPMQREAM